MIQKDTIEPSSSDYSSPTFLVPKPPGENGEKKYRLVVNFQQLNARTIEDSYQLPNPLDIIDNIGGATVFSTLDLAEEFFQLPLDPADKHETAFS